MPSGGALYLAVAVALNAIFLNFAFRVWRTEAGPAQDKAAKGLFAYSILYLFLVFSLLLAEKMLGLEGIGALALYWSLAQMTEENDEGRRHEIETPHWTEEQLKKRRQRNLAIAWTLAGLIALFFVVTIVKLGGNVANRPI